MGPRDIDAVESALSAAEINYVDLFQGFFLPVFSCMFLRQMIAEEEATTRNKGHGLMWIKVSLFDNSFEQCVMGLSSIW